VNVAPEVFLSVRVALESRCSGGNSVSRCRARYRIDIHSRLDQTPIAAMPADTDGTPRRLVEELGTTGAETHLHYPANWLAAGTARSMRQEPKPENPSRHCAAPSAGLGSPRVCEQTIRRQGRL